MIRAHDCTEAELNAAVTEARRAIHSIYEFVPQELYVDLWAKVWEALKLLTPDPKP